MKETEITETRIASIYRDENSVIVTTMKNCGLINEEDVMDLNEALKELSDEQPALKLTILTGKWEMTNKAKELADREDQMSKTKARALVVSGNLKSSIFNFLKSFSERPYPHQFFHTQEEAYNWLMNFKNDGLREPHF